MITYVNSKEAKLFEDARKELGLAAEANFDLDEYLNNLQTLAAKSPRYVRLPLYEDGHEDEEIFEIDANARTIKIPASFSKNGVGVVSDELAETVWFKINRYFDIKDFGKAAGVNSDVLTDGQLHILIQWEAPDGAKGASWAYAIDKDTDPEYIYFGWALTAEHLTAKAGNIRFAVRIMEYNIDGDIAYSFATQAAAVAVRAGLSFDLTDNGVEFESVADKIANRLLGGQIAHCPVFAPATEDPEYAGGDLPAYVLNLAVPQDAPEGTPAQAKLEVVAAAPEGEEYDAIAYKWYKKGSNDADFAQIEGEYTPALTVTSSGEYYVVVFGMKEIVDNMEYIYDAENEIAAEGKFKYHTSIASTKSTICTIPAPIKLAITEEMAKYLIIREGATLVLGIERQMIGEDPVGEVELAIERTASAEKDLDLEAAEFTPVGEPTEGSAAVEEAWIWNEVAYSTEAAAIEAKGESEGEIEHREAQDAVPATAGVTYLVDGGVVTIDMAKAAEGYYRITVINKLNGDHEDTVSTVLCRVVKPAEVNGAVAKIYDIRGNEVSPKGAVIVHDKIVANVTINGLSDELEIKWYKVAGGAQDTEPVTEGDLAVDTLIEGATGNTYEPVDDGFFYFVAINKVEDSEAVLSSNVVEFTA